jgi:hypothetical protein
MVGDVEIEVSIRIASHIETIFRIRLIQDMMVLTRVEMQTVSGRIWATPKNVAGPCMASMVPISPDKAHIHTEGHVCAMEDIFHTFIFETFHMDLCDLGDPIEYGDSDESDDTVESETDIDEDLDDDLDEDLDEDLESDDDGFSTPPPPQPKKRSRDHHPPPAPKKHKKYILRYRTVHCD